MGEGVPDGVVGDAPRLKQVLLNLIGNGVKFTEKGGVTLRLSSQPAGEKAARVRFEVQDTGIGIPAQAQQQVFQPFHQVDSTRSRLRGGTGLGLAISQRIVETMGGRIEVSSRPLRRRWRGCPNVPRYTRAAWAVSSVGQSRGLISQGDPGVQAPVENRVNSAKPSVGSASGQPGNPEPSPPKAGLQDR